MSQSNQKSSINREPSLDIEQDECLLSKFSSNVCEDKSTIKSSKTNEKIKKSKKPRIKFLKLRKMINSELEAKSEKSNSFQNSSKIAGKNLIKSSNSLESTSSKSSILKSSSSLTSLITSFRTSISTSLLNSDNHSLNMVTATSSTNNLLPNYFSNLSDKELMDSKNEMKKETQRETIEKPSACFFKARSTSISGFEVKVADEKSKDSENVENLKNDATALGENGNKLSAPTARLLKHTQSLDHDLIPKASIDSMQSDDCINKLFENSQVHSENLLIETKKNSKKIEKKQIVRTESTDETSRTEKAAESSSEKQRERINDELGAERSTVLNSSQPIELIEKKETAKAFESNEKGEKKNVQKKNEIIDRLEKSKSNSNLSSMIEHNAGDRNAAEEEEVLAAIKLNTLNELNNSSIANTDYLKEPSSSSNLSTSRTKEGEKNISKSANGDLANSNAVKERRINEDELNSHFNSYLTPNGSNSENLKTKNLNNNSNNSRILNRKRINKSKSINNLRDNLVDSSSTNQSSTSLTVDDESRNSKKQNSTLRSKSFNHLTNNISKKTNKSDNLNQQPVAELNQQQQPLKATNRLNQKGGALCKLKKFAKGFNSSSSSPASSVAASSSKNRIRESLCAQSKNCIEQLLLHEQCKTDSNKCNSPLSGIKNEIKMKKMRFRRSDHLKEEYNLTKSMKTVDYKDTLLRQILAFKTIRSKLKSLNQEKTQKVALNKNTNQLSSQTQQIPKATIGSQKSKFFSLNKMVLPDVQQTGSVCTETGQTECFDIYSKKDHQSLFTSKLIKNDESFNCENIQSNKQVIPSIQQFTDQQLVHQCKKGKKCDNELKRKPNKWIQLSGHDQSFFNSDKPGVILKKNEQNESIAYKKINEMNDKIIEFMPKFYSVIDSDDGNQFIELQDLLAQFDNP